MVTLAIQHNNTATNDPCALCRRRTDPVVGPELFISGTWAIVCHDCGRLQAPELVKVLSTYRSELNKDRSPDGCCDVCGAGDGHLNIGRVHIGVCHAHKTRWSIGSNLYSDWRYETEEIWQQNADRIEGYRDQDESPAIPSQLRTINEDSDPF